MRASLSLREEFERYQHLATTALGGFAEAKTVRMSIDTASGNVTYDESVYYTTETWRALVCLVDCDAGAWSGRAQEESVSMLGDEGREHFAVHVLTKRGIYGSGSSADGRHFYVRAMHPRTLCYMDSLVFNEPGSTACDEDETSGEHTGSRFACAYAKQTARMLTDYLGASTAGADLVRKCMASQWNEQGATEMHADKVKTLVFALGAETLRQWAGQHYDAHKCVELVYADADDVDTKDIVNHMKHVRALLRAPPRAALHGETDASCEATEAVAAWIDHGEELYNEKLDDWTTTSAFVADVEAVEDVVRSTCHEASWNVRVSQEIHNMDLKRRARIMACYAGHEIMPFASAHPYVAMMHMKLPDLSLLRCETLKKCNDDAARAAVLSAKWCAETDAQVRSQIMESFVSATKAVNHVHSTLIRALVWAYRATVRAPVISALRTAGASSVSSPLSSSTFSGTKLHAWQVHIVKLVAKRCSEAYAHHETLAADGVPAVGRQSVSEIKWPHMSAVFENEKNGALKAACMESCVMRDVAFNFAVALVYERHGERFGREDSQFKSASQWLHRLERLRRALSTVLRIAACQLSVAAGFNNVYVDMAKAKVRDGLSLTSDVSSACKRIAAGKLVAFTNETGLNLGVHYLIAADIVEQRTRQALGYRRLAHARLEFHMARRMCAFEAGDVQLLLNRYDVHSKLTRLCAAEGGKWIKHAAGIGNVTPEEKKHAVSAMLMEAQSCVDGGETDGFAQARGTDAVLHKEFLAIAKQHTKSMTVCDQANLFGDVLFARDTQHEVPVAPPVVMTHDAPDVGAQISTFSQVNLLGLDKQMSRGAAPRLRKTERRRCALCGEVGHNKRTCRLSTSGKESIASNRKRARHNEQRSSQGRARDKIARRRKRVIKDTDSDTDGDDEAQGDDTEDDRTHVELYSDGTDDEEQDELDAGTDVEGRDEKSGARVAQRAVISIVNKARAVEAGRVGSKADTRELDY